MATSVTTLLERVRYKIIDPDSVNFSDAELMVYLNEADRTIRNTLALHAPELIEEKETGVINSDNYRITLSNYVTRITDVRINGKYVSKLGKGRVVDTDREGKPVGYIVNGFNEIQFYPKPSEDYVYTVSYIPNMEALDLTDDSHYPEMFDDVLSEFVVLRCIARDEEQPTIESELYRNWNNQLLQLVSLFGYDDSTIKGYYSGGGVNDDYGVV